MLEGEVLHVAVDAGHRVRRVGVFNFGTDRVRVLEKTPGSGSGTDRVRVLALHFLSIGYHRVFFGYIPDSHKVWFN